MKRVLIALLLVVTGLAGLFLASCGGLLMAYVKGNGSNHSDEQFAGAMIAGGVVIIALTIWGIVKLIRSRNGGP